MNQKRYENLDSARSGAVVNANLNRSISSPQHQHTFLLNEYQQQPSVSRKNETRLTGVSRRLQSSRRDSGSFSSTESTNKPAVLAEDAVTGGGGANNLWLPVMTPQNAARKPSPPNAFNLSAGDGGGGGGGGGSGDGGGTYDIMARNQRRKTSTTNASDQRLIVATSSASSSPTSSAPSATATTVIQQPLATSKENNTNKNTSPITSSLSFPQFIKSLQNLTPSLTRKFQSGGGMSNATGHHHTKKNRQAQVYNFLERPTGWKCFIYHFTV